MAPFDPPSLKTPTLEPNMKGIGRRIAELWQFEILHNVRMYPEVGRQYSYFLHWRHTLLFHYIRNIVYEE